MEEFFQSVSHAFEQNRGSSEAFEAMLAGLLLGAGVLQLLSWFRRLRARATQFEAFARERGLSPSNAALLKDIAGANSVSALELATQLELFERLTAEALANGRASESAGAPIADQLRQIRQALGFDRLPAHNPLFSTRELAPGIALELGSQFARVVEVTETSFTVELPGPASLVVDQRVQLTLSHAREARYVLSCQVVEVMDSTRVRLTHDETPARVQQRALARAPAHGPITLTPLFWPGGDNMTHDFLGQLKDVSGGGVRIVTKTCLPVGLLANASFTLVGDRFQDYRVVVLSCKESGTGATLEAQLEFTGLLAQERERLIGAVTRLQLGHLNPRTR